jgi:plasmid stabilization system protein ParE
VGQLLEPQKAETGSETLGDMNILWSPEAIEDLNMLRAYIAQANPTAARVVLHIMHSIEQFAARHHSNSAVRRQGFLDTERAELRESLAHLVGFKRLMRSAVCGVARWSCV